jgi:hypothetical protein
LGQCEIESDRGSPLREPMAPRYRPNRWGLEETRMYSGKSTVTLSASNNSRACRSQTCALILALLERRLLPE